MYSRLVDSNHRKSIILLVWALWNQWNSSSYFRGLKWLMNELSKCTHYKISSVCLLPIYFMLEPQNSEIPCVTIWSALLWAVVTFWIKWASGLNKRVCTSCTLHCSHGIALMHNSGLVNLLVSHTRHTLPLSSAHSAAQEEAPCKRTNLIRK